jgi:UDP-N-acetylglucosamine transferase subunit ALG13
MKRIFATVGTTSFDPFVESICSMPFLTATLQCRYASTQKPPSDQPALSLQSTSDQQLLWRSCEILHCSKSSSCTQLPLGFSQHSSSTDPDQETEEDTVELLIQYGRGCCPLQFLPPTIIGGAVQSGTSDDEGFISVRLPIDNGTTKHVTMNIKWYRFKPSLTADMECADLILCHAGAGTLLEAMSLKPQRLTATTNKSTNGRVINAVINSELMDNHQSELADELEKRKHIRVTKEVKKLMTVSGSRDFWIEVNDFVPKPFADGRGMSQVEAQVSNFQRIVDRVMH